MYTDETWTKYSNCIQDIYTILYVKFLTRHPEDVKNHTDEAGQNTERNYIIRAKCIEDYIMALCL